MELWSWLFPATYILHILEEGLAGERFYNWSHRIIGRRIPARAFLVLNASFLGLMVAAAVVLRSGEGPWLLPTLGTITALNGLGHFAGSVITRSYSPGVITGLLLWMPLGIAALLLSKQALPMGAWWQGVIAGLLSSGLVVCSALLAGRGTTR
jgi:hypothetical protein